jgi:hypothetical protein
MQSGDNQAQFWDRVLRLDRNAISDRKRDFRINFGAEF